MVQGLSFVHMVAASGVDIHLLHEEEVSLLPVQKAGNAVQIRGQPFLAPSP